MEGEAKTMNLEVVTPERVAIKDKIKQITIPTEEGEITVMPGHTPLVSCLATGMLEANLSKNGDKEVLAIMGGFVEITGEKIIVLADSADHGKELDLDMVEEARKKAEEKLKSIRYDDTESFASARAQIAIEFARSKAIKRWQQIKGYGNS